MSASLVLLACGGIAELDLGSDQSALQSSPGATRAPTGSGSTAPVTTPANPRPTGYTAAPAGYASDIDPATGLPVVYVYCDAPDLEGEPIAPAVPTPTGVGVESAAANDDATPAPTTDASGAPVPAATPTSVANDAPTPAPTTDASGAPVPAATPTSAANDAPLPPAVPVQDEPTQIPVPVQPGMQPPPPTGVILVCLPDGADLAPVPGNPVPTATPQTPANPVPTTSTASAPTGNYAAEPAPANPQPTSDGSSEPEPDVD